jgi:hypothetical protein
MSTQREIAFLEALAVINSLLQLVGRANQAALELSAYFERIRAEGREPTDAELDELRQKSLDARDQLQGLN